MVLVLGTALLAAPVSAQNAPTARLSVAPDPAHPGQAIVLDGRNSTSPSEPIATCEFDVDGDGTYEVQRDTCRIDYEFATVGEFDVGLRVTDDAGQQATDTATIRVVENEPPEPAVNVDPTRAVPGEPVTLSAENSVDPDGTIVAYTWIVGSANLSGETVTRRFETPGTYGYRLTVTDDDGRSARETGVVTVERNERPTASIVLGTDDPRVEEPIMLDAGGSVDQDGSVVSYRWDLDGDGAVDSETAGATTRVEVDTPGEYDAGVTVVDDRGATDRATLSYTVAAVATQTSVAMVTATPTETDPAGAAGGLLALALAVIFIVLVLAGAVVGVRHRALVGEKWRTLLELLARGDVRHRLAKILSRTTVKQGTKRVLRRLSDLIEAAGDGLGEGVERVGRAIKRGSERLAAWLRRLGS